MVTARLTLRDLAVLQIQIHDLVHSCSLSAGVSSRKTSGRHMTTLGTVLLMLA